MCYISEAPHAREALYLAPWLSKSTHPRKFDNHVTVHRPPSVRTTGKPMFTLSLWEPKRELIAYQCCDQLTAVKTGHQLTSIT